MITVYTKPACVQCRATTRTLDKYKLEYQEVDISQNEQARAHLMKMGHMQAPVVDTGVETWSGFRPDRIENLSPL
ncbi:glutaredoxin-like protein NrdH [Candidatus Saccharibacteria bacterium]|nr:glutaredoxin-like protein NrdH [Candidatus Saccharibacteria bacterium]